jgi:hypothetical protein
MIFVDSMFLFYIQVLFQFIELFLWIENFYFKWIIVVFQPMDTSIDFFEIGISFVICLTHGYNG